MNATTGLMTVASMIALVSATPAIASSGSTGCSPSGKIDLYEYFHNAKLHPVDDLANYRQDHSAYALTRTATVASREASIETRPNDAAVRTRAETELDLKALRAYFHSGPFNASDGLSNYSGDYRFDDIGRRESDFPTQVVSQR